MYNVHCMIVVSVDKISKHAIIINLSIESMINRVAQSLMCFIIVLISLILLTL